MKLNILHTNDIHSNIEQMAYGSSYINKVRNLNRNTLLVDGGDMITGEFQFKYNLGRVEQEISNYLKYDVVTVGNHDFDLGLPFLKKHMNGINSQYIISNLIDTCNQLGSYQQSIIKEVNGLKVGFISFLLPYVQTQIEFAFNDNFGIEFIEIEQAQAIIDSIKDEVDIVIALNHHGIERDIFLAQKTAGIDIIIGAHSHTELLAPLIENDTYIVQTGCFGKNIGHLELEITNKQISNVNYHMQVMDESLGIDNQLQAIIDNYINFANQSASEVYGIAANVLNGQREHLVKHSTNLGALVCDSYLDYAKERGFNPDFAFINARGLRQNIEVGAITAKTLYNVMPFEKKLLILEISGEDLIAGLTNPIELQTAGLKIIKDDNNKQFFDRTIDNPIIADKTYQVATMDYVYNHHHFSRLQNGRVIASNLGLDTDIVSSYIKKLGNDFAYESNMMVEYCEKI